MSCNRGNVLFIILVGILLSALVAETVRNLLTSERNVDGDRARILTAHIDEQETMIRSAYNMLRFANQCDVEEINFSLTADVAYNPNAPVSGRCSMYHEKGGALSALQPDSEAQKPLDNAYETTWIENAGIEIAGLGTTNSADVNCSGCDLALLLYNVTDEVCREVNMNRMGSLKIYDMESGGEITQRDFDGTFVNNTLLDAADDPSLEEQRAFCIKETGGSGRNIYLSVLEVR